MAERLKRYTETSNQVNNIGEAQIQLLRQLNGNCDGRWWTVTEMHKAYCTGVGNRWACGVKCEDYSLFCWIWKVGRDEYIIVPIDLVCDEEGNTTSYEVPSNKGNMFAYNSDDDDMIKIDNS